MASEETGPQSQPSNATEATARTTMSPNAQPMTADPREGIADGDASPPETATATTTDKDEAQVQAEPSAATEAAAATANMTAASSNSNSTTTNNMRACQISISVFKTTETDRWGVGFEQGSATIMSSSPSTGPSKCNGVVISAIADTSEEEEEALLLGPILGLLQKGDMLWSINGMRYRKANRAIQRLLSLKNGYVTLVFMTNVGENVHPNVMEAIVLKQNLQTRLGIGFQNVVTSDDDAAEANAANDKDESKPTELKADEVESKDDDDGIVKVEEAVDSASPAAVDAHDEKQEDAPTESQETDSDNQQDKDDGDANNNDGDKERTRLLAVRVIDPNAIMASSLLKANDLILCVNGQAASHWTSKEAIDRIKAVPDMVRLTALRTQHEPTRAQKMMRHAKRAGIALGGGTMVGVGLIFIPTLPPPFGEVLIVGGISVLGTEFEGPKKVMRGARDSLARAVGPEEEEDGRGEQEQGGEQGQTVVAASSSESDDAEGNTTAVDATNTTTTNSTDEEPTSKENNNDLQRSHTVDTVESSTGSDAEKNDGTKRKSMKDRFKRFGRNVVLPFLDQVVGDNDRNVGGGSSNNETTTTTAVEVSQQ